MKMAFSFGRTAFAPHLALLAVQLMFGTWPIAGKIALRALPSTGLVALRVSGAAIAFVLLQKALAQPIFIKRRSDYLRLALYSLLGVVINQILFVKGLSLSTVINATLLGTVIPVFTLLISMSLGYEQASWRKAAGVLLAAGGVIYLIDPLHAELAGEHMHGNLLLIVNAACYGAYIAISQDLIKRYGALTVITWVFVFGSAATLPVGGFYLAQVPLAELSASVWLAMLYIILVPTVGAYYLNARALKSVAPSTVAVYIYLQPLIAFTLAPLLLGEQLNSRTWIAAALIFAGVTVATQSPPKKNAETSECPDVSTT